MVFPDSRLKRALRKHLPWLRTEQRLTAAYISQRLFRRHFVVTRRQVARYVTTRKNVLFGPGFPHAGSDYAIIKTLVRLGIRATLVREARDPEAVFAWSDSTLVPSDDLAALVSVYGRVINANCVDIGKDRVEHVHQSVLGYGLAVDPRAVGTHLRKSIENSTHDARIFDTATEPERGYVYQRPIRNRFAARLFEEIRLPYVGGCLSVCMLKLKVDERRFAGMPAFSELPAFESDQLYAVANAVPLALMLSPDETAQIDRFAAEMGLDCGELDVIRDVEDGRVYVIDVNKTAAGPTIALGSRDMRRYLDAYAGAVEALLARFSVS